MKKKTSRVVILILFVLALLGIMLAPRGDASGFDGGYPAPAPTATAWAYPAPLDPRCEEAVLLGMRLPLWCTTEDALLAPQSVVQDKEEEETPTATAVGVMKIGGRAKGKQ